MQTHRSGCNNVSSGIGGSWGASSAPVSNAPSVAAQARIAANGPPVNHTPIVHISGHPGAANTSGKFEKNMIMELYPLGGRGMKLNRQVINWQAFVSHLLI